MQNLRDFSGAQAGDQNASNRHLHGHLSLSEIELGRQVEQGYAGCLEMPGV